MHQALDIVLDAIAEEQREEPKTRKRARANPELPKLVNVTEEEKARALKAWERAGYRKTG
jgi:hypothetical protein